MVHQCPAVHARRVVAFQDTKKQGATAIDNELKACLCQGSMFSNSAFGVGRADDTVEGSCGAGSEGIVVTGVSDIFTRVVENPVQSFIPVGFVNREKSSYRPLSGQDFFMSVQGVRDEDYYYTANNVAYSSELGRDVSPPQDLAGFTAYFKVSDRNFQGMNGQATDVQIQWVEVPDSVSLLEVLDAKLYGGQQISKCPPGGSVLTPVAAASVECLIGNNKCSDPDVKKMLVGRLVVCKVRSVGSVHGSVGW